MRNGYKRGYKKRPQTVKCRNLAGARDFLKLPKQGVDSVQFTAIIRTLLLTN